MTRKDDLLKLAEPYLKGVMYDSISSAIEYIENEYYQIDNGEHAILNLSNIVSAICSDMKYMPENEERYIWARTIISEVIVHTLIALLSEYELETKRVYNKGE